MCGGSLESLDSGHELVGGICDEGVEGVPKTRLADELQGGAPHPVEHVDLDGPVIPGDARLDTFLELGIGARRTVRNRADR